MRRLTEKKAKRIEAAINSALLWNERVDLFALPAIIDQRLRLALRILMEARLS